MKKFTAEEKKKLGRAIRDRRLALGYRQKEIAEQANVSIARLSNVERGRNRPLIELYFRLCRVLKMPKPPFSP